MKGLILSSFLGLSLLASVACGPKQSPADQQPSAPPAVLAFMRAEETFDKDHLCQYLADPKSELCLEALAGITDAQAHGIQPLGGGLIGVHPTRDGGTVTAYYDTARINGQVEEVVFVIYANREGKVTRVE